MAVIQTIRNRAGLLVAIVIGMALVAFILGDFLKPKGGNQSGRQDNVIAEINGQDVSYDDYLYDLNKQEKLYEAQGRMNEQARQELKTRVWQELLDDHVLQREYDKLGIDVNNQELYDLIGGSNPHQYIAQSFTNPDGSLNSNALSNYLLQIKELSSDDIQKQIYLNLENAIYNERKAQKYYNLIIKGLYATNIQTKRRQDDLNTTINLSYIVKRYNEIPDSSVSVSEDELKAYYKEHKNEYEQIESRDLRCVVWEVVPSENDFEATSKWINDVSSEFKPKKGDEAIAYIKANSDIKYNNKYWAEGLLDSTINGFLFNAEIGDVYGPYLEDNYYKLTKLINVDYLPDSVKVSQILFRIDESNYQRIQPLADSLKKLIEQGHNFAELAEEHSADASSLEKGGDMGWLKEGEQPKPFNDSVFLAKKGDVKIVYTNYGLHLLKVTDLGKTTKKVQIGTVAREVIASEQTEQHYYSLASTFGGTNNSKEKFDEAVKNKDLKVIEANNVTKSAQQVVGIEDSRELVRWAYRKGKEGMIAQDVFNFRDKYVVVILDKIRKDGVADLEEVKTQIEIEVKKQKTAEILKNQLAEAAQSEKDINLIASKLKAEVKTATNIRFSSYVISGMGPEPKVIGLVASMKENEISEPIAGVNGVYLIQANGVNASDVKGNPASEKSYIERQYATKVYQKAKNVLEKMAEVDDNRINFF